MDWMEKQLDVHGVECNSQVDVSYGSHSDDDFQLVLFVIAN